LVLCDVLQERSIWKELGIAPASSQAIFFLWDRSALKHPWWSWSHDYPYWVCTHLN